MALYLGDRKLTLFKGDRKPYALYKSEKQITGAIKTKLKGLGRVTWKSPYQAEIPSVTVHGKGGQDKLSGKNLAVPPKLKTKESNGITYTVNEDGSINAKGKLNKTYSDGFIVPLQLKDGVYALSQRLYYVCTEKATGKLRYFSQKAFITDKYDTSEAYYYTGTSGSVGEVIDKVIYPQIEYGETSTLYESYCGGIPAPNPIYPIEPRFNANARLVSRGVNLFSGEGVKVRNYKGQIINEYVIRYEKKLYIKILHKKDEPIPTDFFAGILNIPEIGSSSADWAISNGIQKKTEYPFPKGFSDTKKTIMLGIYPPNRWDYFVSNFDVQLEIGTTPTPYKLYFDGGEVNVPVLRAIPDTDIRDEFDAQTGTVTRRIHEMIFDGSDDERWKEWKESPKHKCWEVPFNKKPLSWAVTSISNLFKNNFGSYDDNCTFYVATSTITTFWDGWKTEEELRAYLKNTPLKVWYPLKEPIIEHVDTVPLRQNWDGQILQIGGDLGDTEIDAEVFEEYRG